jgi:hypothetical protein
MPFLLLWRACLQYVPNYNSEHTFSCVDALAFLAQAWTKCETSVISRVFVFPENCVAIVFVSGGFCIIKLVAFDLHEADFQIPLDEPPQRHVSHVFWELEDILRCGGMMQPCLPRSSFYFRFRWHQLFIVFSAEVYAYRTNFMSFVSFSNIFLRVICLSPWTSSYTGYLSQILILAAPWCYKKRSLLHQILLCHLSQRIHSATLRLHDDSKKEAKGC